MKINQEHFKSDPLKVIENEVLINSQKYNGLTTKQA